jgi:hypothetical protein
MHEREKILREKRVRIEKVASSPTNVRKCVVAPIVHGDSQHRFQALLLEPHAVYDGARHIVDSQRVRDQDQRPFWISSPVQQNLRKRSERIVSVATASGIGDVPNRALP